MLAQSNKLKLKPMKNMMEVEGKDKNSNSPGDKNEEFLCNICCSFDKNITI
jgi:hypothetical protein